MDPREKEAEEHNLNYIGLEGNIGCLGKENNVCHQFQCSILYF